LQTYKLNILVAFLLFLMFLKLFKSYQLYFFVLNNKDISSVIKPLYILRF